MERREKLQLILMILFLVVLVITIGYMVFNKPKDIVHPKVTMKIKDKGELVIELYPEKAPNTVANFVNLVSSGYYNGKLIYGRDINTIHVGRKTDKTEEKVTLKNLGKDSDEKYTIKGEFAKNGFNNDLKHSKYMVSRGRANYTQIAAGLVNESYNSAGGLFNIVMKEDSALDGKYAVFGKVIKGTEILDELYEKEEIVGDGKEEQLKALLMPYKKQILIEEATVDTNSLPKVETEKYFDFDNYLLERVKKQLEAGNKNIQEEK